MERLLGLLGEVDAPNVGMDTVNEEQSGYGERASLSAGDDTKANTRDVAAHPSPPRLEIIVSSRRMAATMEAPSSPI